MRHIHLDPVGGIAGDMFLAAMLHAWPDLEPTAISAMRAVGLPSDWSVGTTPGTSAGLSGLRLSVLGDERDHHHATGSFASIRARIEAAPLRPAVRDRAIDIFRRLAEAEAAVHAVTVEQVHFHEIADWDSIADIVGAAAAIDAVEEGGGGTSWSVGDIPMGSGRVRTAHGPLPVPAPATALLLRGFALIDDGIPGERVTPTGAAILAHLGATQGAPRPAGTLVAVGHGLGTRDLGAIANVFSLLAIDVPAKTTDPVGEPAETVTAETVAVISFEVDDQTPEDLALGLDRLRATDGVVDVVQYPVMAKKGRLATSIRLLCAPESAEAVIEACFLQTTTIGLRWRIERRATLAREPVTVGGVDGKAARRPNGRVTVKPESDAIARRASTQDERAALRRMVETGSERGDG